MTNVYEEQIVSPSRTLSEMLIKRGLSLMELTCRLGMGAKEVNEILLGKRPIDVHTAEQLSFVFEYDASYWNNLQKEYDAFIEREKTNDGITNVEINALKEIPIETLLQKQYITNYPEDPKEQVLFMRRFLRLSNLLNIWSTLENAYFFKTRFPYNPYELAAWMSMVYTKYESNDEMEDTDLVEVRRLISLLKTWSELTVDEIVEKTTEHLKECGVVFLLMSQFKNAPIRNYIKNINGRIILAVSLKVRTTEAFIRAVAVGIGNLLTNRIEKGLVDFEPI